MQVEPRIRRRNVWVMLALIVFALGLCATILLWMRARTARQGGKVYPATSFVVPAAISRDLPVATAAVFDSVKLPSFL